ncbi:MAG: hypothetical protein COV36_07880 [Alphaproteobacteria bacterium CG11_big_fil_rev_8_21_14_0_20_44_7]|nr:MAG: hypothetical protein COV36_07880 [Alphaproteobacteria bacterium CG11_big_fil_rev_8_21_14_0_20_44_7]
MNEQTTLAEMLCTKFCHDIIGPVGAVSNGIEFLFEELPELNSQAAELIDNSSKESVSRLQFYRQAYGQNTSDSGISITETKNLTESFLLHGKVKLDWPIEFTDISGISITSLERKLLLNIIIIAAGSLIKGGTLRVEFTNGSFIVTSEGESIKLDPAIRDFLEGKGDVSNVDARTVQAYYTSLTSKELGKKISIEFDDTKLKFEVKI